MPSGIQDMKVEVVAVGMLHVLTGNAIVSFPGSTKTHPSFYVYISLSVTGVLQGKWKKYFPMEITWDLWQQYAVPVLQYLQANPLTAATLDDQVKIIETLMRGLPGSISQPPAETALVGSEVPDSGLSWPDGTPRLTYPVVT